MDERTGCFEAESQVGLNHQELADVRMKKTQ
jgi:hypothetical protein